MGKVSLPVAGELYRHFKGGLYRVQCTASCSETHEVQVVYRSVTNGQAWVRPLARFMEHVTHLGASVPRFERLHEGLIERQLTRVRSAIRRLLRTPSS